MKGKKPNRLHIAGDPYRLVVLQVLDHDEQGRPSSCRLMYEDQSVNIQGGEKFLTIFASERGLAPSDGN